MTEKRSRQQTGDGTREESSRVRSRFFTRETFTLLLASVAICVSSLGLWFSTRDQARTHIVEFAQRKQEIRLEMVRGWLQSVDLEATIDRHYGEIDPKRRGALDEIRRLASENSKLIREGAEQIERLDPSNNIASRIALESIAGQARVITEQGNAINEKAKELLRKSENAAQQQVPADASARRPRR